MSASTDAVQAMLSRMRECRRITRADIEALLDAVIEQQTAAFVRDARQAGHTAAEVQTILDTNRTMLRDWRRDTLRDMIDGRFGPSSGDAPTGCTVQ